METNKRELKFKLTGDELQNLKCLQESLIETLRRDGEILADQILSNPNTKVSVFFQPNAAYVLNGVGHLSAVVNKIRLLDSGVEFTKMDYTQKIDATEKSDPNLVNYNLKSMEELEPSMVSFSFTILRQVQSWQNRLSQLV